MKRKEGIRIDGHNLKNNYGKYSLKSTLLFPNNLFLTSIDAELYQNCIEMKIKQHFSIFTLARIARSFPLTRFLYSTTWQAFPRRFYRGKGDEGYVLLFE